MAVDYKKLNTFNSKYNLQKAIINTTAKIHHNFVGIIIYNFLYNYTISKEQTNRIYFRDHKLHVKFAKKVIKNIISIFKDNWRKLEEFVEVNAINYVLIPGYTFDIKDNWGLVYFR